MKYNKDNFDDSAALAFIGMIGALVCLIVAAAWTLFS